MAPTEQRRTVTLAYPGSLHAQPAARAREAVRGLDAAVVLHYGERQASLASLVAMLALAAGEGATVELVASGCDAGTALDAVLSASAATSTASPSGACAAPKTSAATCAACLAWRA